MITYRELRILHLLMEGRTPREIAGTLSITRQTVYYHIRKLQEKGYVEKIGKEYVPTEKAYALIGY